MEIFWNEKSHLKYFVELNNAWIEQYFKLEQADLDITDDPGKILRDGGHILTIIENDRVIGCCALFKVENDEYELARMAVLESKRGKGIGKLLMNETLDYAKKINAKRLFLISNTKLKPAIALYKKYGFDTIHIGQHPFYNRGNIEMEKYI